MSGEQNTLDTESLVIRNKAIAEAFHATSPRYHVRRMLLQTLSMVPVSPCPEPRRERILLIRPDHLGDLLLATPAMQALREAAPHVEIHALVGPWSSAALSTHEAVDQVLTLDFPGFNRGGSNNLASPYKLAWKTAKQLRRVRYSSAVIMRPDHWWGAMVAFLAGIPHRVGHAHPDVSPFLTHPRQVDARHAVLQNAALMEAWTGPLDMTRLRLEFRTLEDDRDYVNTFLEKQGIKADQRIFCIHPGAGARVKQWTGARWAAVADTLMDQLDAVAVITGTGAELPLAKDIAQRMDHQPCVIAGETQIGQLAALYERSLVVLGPDSGPLHLAAAVGTATVALFGPADPEEFAPFGTPDRHIVLTSDIGCRPCRVLDWASDNLDNHPCVRDISVGRVLEAARLTVQARQA